MKIKYDVAITESGSLARTFLKSNHSATLMNAGENQELNDMVIAHRKDELSEDICAGDRLKICDSVFTVTKVGEAANANLRQSGHCTIRFNEEATLPGQISVEGSPLPELAPGRHIMFYQD